MRKRAAADWALALATLEQAIKDLAEELEPVPGDAEQPGACGARAVVFDQEGQDAGIGAGGGAASVGKHPADTMSDKRDRALIGLMTYLFARIGAALSMELRDVNVLNRRLWVRLHEKGGKLHEMACRIALSSIWTTIGKPEASSIIHAARYSRRSAGAPAY